MPSKVRGAEGRQADHGGGRAGAVSGETQSLLHEDPRGPAKERGAKETRLSLHRRGEGCVSRDAPARPPGLL